MMHTSKFPKINTGFVLPGHIYTILPKVLTTLHSLCGQKYWHPSLEEKKALPNCANKDGNIIHVLKNSISTSVATVLKYMR